MKQRMIAKHEIYNSMEELRNDYHTSHAHVYQQMKTGDTFSHDWLESDFTAPCNGVVYQMSKNNIFSGFVFIKEVM